MKNSAIWKVVRVKDVDLERVYAFLGEPGTLLYVPEPGHYNEKLKIFIRIDGSAVQLLGGKPYPCAAPTDFIESSPDWVYNHPKTVPMWAARYWFRIKEVSHPKLPSSMSDEEIYKLGFKKNDDLFTYPGIDVECGSVKEAFRYVFNHFYSRWKEVMIDGVKTAVLYAFDESNEFLPEYTGDCVSKVVIPYIEVYHLEPVYE